MNAHLPSTEELQALFDLGVSWARLDFNWDDLEPTREGYDYRLTDRIVDALVAHGVRVYATLAYTPGWANGGQGRNTPPVDTRDWWNFCANVAGHLRGRIGAYGMWNEPNLTGFFSGSVAQYINAILEPGHQAIKTVDPTIVVSGPELAMMSDWQRWLDTILRRGGQYLDVVTQHSYQDDGHAVIRSFDGYHSHGKPIWLTETGWNADKVGDAAQADYYDQLLESLPSANLLKVFPFDLNSEGVGIMGRPAFQVYRRYIQASRASV
jgi:hypothetical protein